MGARREAPVILTVDAPAMHAAGHAFYQAANAEIADGKLTVPAAGTATDGQACQTTRDFALIDQDQSDNVVSQYLVTAGGQTAQNSPANSAKLTGATVLTNGSDDALLSYLTEAAGESDMRLVIEERDGEWFAESRHPSGLGGEMVVYRANGPDRRRAMLSLAQRFADSR